MSNAVIFGEYAVDYARSRPRYPGALWQWVASLCDSHVRAWDAGCGNGQASIELAEHFNQVTATDISADQIAHAPKHPRVSYQVAASETVRFERESLDLVCVAQALHWFDLADFWLTVLHALKPQGVFLAMAYGQYTIDEAIDAISQSSFLDVAAPYQARGNQLIARGYLDIKFPFELIAAPALAIECEWSLDELIAYVATWSAVARMRKEKGLDPLPAYRKALESVWGMPSSKRLVRMPLVIKAGRRSGNPELT